MFDPLVAAVPEFARLLSAELPEPVACASAGVMQSTLAIATERPNDAPNKDIDNLVIRHRLSVGIAPACKMSSESAA